jgi:hypothetical protein
MKDAVDAADLTRAIVSTNTHNTSKSLKRREAVDLRWEDEKQQTVLFQEGKVGKRRGLLRFAFDHALRD